MNVLGNRERSWRKARKRGVSPIIATILLVAITVVLAAVLYVLISGLTKGPGSAPLGTDFGWGQPSNATGTTGTGCPAGTTSFCYSIEVAGSGGGITTSNVQLFLRNVQGATVAWPAATTIALVSPFVTASGTCNGVATTGCVATYSITTNAWTAVNGFLGAFANGMSVVIATGAITHAAGLTGDEIVASGVSGYSGTVVATVPFS